MISERETDLTWREVKINGDPCHFADLGSQRLYVKERRSTVEGWVGSVKVGNFGDVPAAKVACAERVGIKRPVVAVKPRPQISAVRPTPASRVRESEKQLARYPIADLKKPSTAIEERIPIDPA